MILQFAVHVVRITGKGVKELLPNIQTMKCEEIAKKPDKISDITVEVISDSGGLDAGD
jgi:hypothetical protein